MKKRRFGTIVLCCLVAVACGLGGYVVYALTNSISLKASNSITFNAPDKTFYTAKVTVKYQGTDIVLASGTINHSGQDITNPNYNDNMNKKEIDFEDAINFRDTNNITHEAIVYEIEIANYTEQQIKVQVNPHADTDWYTNTFFNDISTITLNAYDGEKTTIVDTKKITLITTMKSNQYSFKFDNSFSIDLTSNLEN